MFELKTTEDSYRFDQARLTIGKIGDFTLPEMSLSPIHGIIEWKHGYYTLENKAHDPHFLINGKPFWKKKLEHGDAISIGANKLFYHFIAPCTKAQFSPVEHSLLPIHTAEEILKHTACFEKPAAPSPQKISINIQQPEEGYWHLLVLIFSCVFLFIVLFSTSFYITINERAEVERLFAARGLADISMVLDYVKNESIDPPFKNWLDPDFLKEIGQKILPKDLSKFEWINAEGHFLEAPYILRLYSDAHFSRFLLIAQPIASNFQSLLPKATLVVDSDNMTIKEFWKVRDLNRLLISTTGFEGIVKAEIGELIEKADSILLDTLAKGKERLGFKTPEELAMIDPDAAYSIYNAPRYYLVNEPMVEIADRLARNPQDPNLHGQIDQFLKKIEQKKGQVLYTSKGIESVIGARKFFSRKNPLLLGYLQINEGRIEESHLLMPNQQSWSIGAYHHNALVKEDLENLQEEIHAADNLHEKLLSLLKEREEQLQKKGQDLISLIESHLRNPDLLFLTHFNNSFDLYKHASQTSQTILDESLKDLFEKYVLDEKSLNLSQFLAVLDEHQINLGLNQDPEIFGKFYDESIAFEAHLNHLFEMVEQAENLDMLDSLVLVANDLINQKFPETDSNRNSWKKHLKVLCIRKLETILWQPNSEEDFETDSYDIEWKIARILKNGYINDPEGRNFYLSQFLEEND